MYSDVGEMTLDSDHLLILQLLQISWTFSLLCECYCSKQKVPPLQCMYSSVGYLVSLAVRSR